MALIKSFSWQYLLNTLYLEINKCISKIITTKCLAIDKCISKMFTTMC